MAIFGFFPLRGYPMTLAFIAALAIFLLDLATPKGYAPAMLYSAPVLISLWLPWSRSTVVAAAVCTALSVIGFFLSASNADLLEALSNRGLTILTIWITAVLCQTIKNERQLLTHANKDLEARNAQLQQEITERKQAEKHLRHSNGKLEQFAYVASHDMQEPLRMVANFLELLQERYKDKLNSKGIEFIHHATDGATRMRLLIEGLLDVARIQTKGQPFALVEGDLVIKQALANLHLSIQESQAEITCDPLPPLWGDRIQLVQLFQNLIGNAIKYRGERSPVVHVGALRETEGVRDLVLFVRDQGIGLDPKFADDVFLLFRRLHTSAEYSGTGIGLALCKGIVERHDGRIWVESQPGLGATFFVTLPEKKYEVSTADLPRMAS